MFELDHIQPVSRGGTTHGDNLAAACRRCNLNKGNQLSSTDPVTGLCVRLFNPRSDTWVHNFGASGASDHRLVGTSVLGRATAALLFRPTKQTAEQDHRWAALLGISHETAYLMLNAARGGYLLGKRQEVRRRLVQANDTLALHLPLPETAWASQSSLARGTPIEPLEGLSATEFDMHLQLSDPDRIQAGFALLLMFVENSYGSQSPTLLRRARRALKLGQGVFVQREHLEALIHADLVLTRQELILARFQGRSAVVARLQQRLIELTDIVNPQPAGPEAELAKRLVRRSLLAALGQDEAPPSRGELAFALEQLDSGSISSLRAVVDLTVRAPGNIGERVLDELSSIVAISGYGQHVDTRRTVQLRLRWWKLFLRLGRELDLDLFHHDWQRWRALKMPKQMHLMAAVIDDARSGQFGAANTHLAEEAVAILR